MQGYNKSHKQVFLGSLFGSVVGVGVTNNINSLHLPQHALTHPLGAEKLPSKLCVFVCVCACVLYVCVCVHVYKHTICVHLCA